MQGRKAIHTMAHSLSFTAMARIADTNVEAPAFEQEGVLRHPGDDLLNHLQVLQPPGIDRHPCFSL